MCPRVPFWPLLIRIYVPAPLSPVVTEQLSRHRAIPGQTEDCIDGEDFWTLEDVSSIPIQYCALDAVAPGLL